MTLEEIISYCQQNGFVYPSSEIYGGLSATYDYGPLGVELLNNIKSHWYKNFVYNRKDIVGLDSAIMTKPEVWVASGHVSSFSDPMLECKKCKTRIRFDTWISKYKDIDDKESIEFLESVWKEFNGKIACVKCGLKDFTSPKAFNLLVKSNYGSATDPDNFTYLRGETCQGIYLNYRNVVQTCRQTLPFGIAQIGKAFRNEITARQFIFRTREFEQMEMQYFVAPESEIEYYNLFKEGRMNYYKKIGINSANLKFEDHEKLAHYAKAAVDIQYKFPFGYKELEGIHARGNFDLNNHQESSKVNLEYTDTASSRRFLPHIVETSTGVGRNFLMHICEWLKVEELETGEKRTVLKIPYAFAPIKACVSPLLRNNADLVKKADEVWEIAKDTGKVAYDDSGNIGKRYRRMDEIGCLYFLTIDHQTLDDDTLTIRYRDSMEQERIHLSEISKAISQ